MQHERLRNRLEEALLQTTNELKRLGVYDPKTDDWEAVPEVGSVGRETDENVGADVAEDWGARRAILSELETRYRNIERALHKMDEGTYGICEISGLPIEDERLIANPAARTNLANIDREKELPL